METRTISTGHGDVAIREWGDPADRLLVALHSMGPVSTGALYNCAVGPLVDAGYHVVAPDLPGYGLTAALPPEEYDVAQAQGAALFHLGRARQTATWPALQEERTPTLLLLATEPESALEQNRRAGHAFKAVVHQAEVQLLEGATHSLVTDLRVAFGQVVAEWLAAAGSAAIE